MSDARLVFFVVFNDAVQPLSVLLRKCQCTSVPEQLPSFILERSWSVQGAELR